MSLAELPSSELKQAAPAPGSEVDVLKKIPPGQVWAAQVFRALMTAQERAGYQQALEQELPPDSEPQSIGGARSDDAPVVIMTREPFPGYRAVYALVLKAVYYLIAPAVSFFVPRRRDPRSMASRPLRIFRMTSMISQGGVAKVCLQSMLPMPAEQVEFTLMVFGEKKGWAPELATREDFTLLQRKLLLWPSSYHPKLFRNLIKLARILRKAQPDLIHLHEPQFTPAVRIAAMLAGGIPLVVHLHNDYNERSQSIRENMLGMTLHALRNSHLIACSQTIYQAAVAWLGKTRHPIELIEDGSDDVFVEKIEDGLPERLRQAAAGKPIVAMMAHLVPHKRLDDFMNGCRILLDEGHELYVLLMCYGKLRNGRSLRKRFNRKFEPGEGEFLFRVKNPQRLMPQVGVGVSTSILEGLGLNVLEYQVEGVPVVVTDLMPHREMVTHGDTGLLFPPFDVAEFLRAMRQILNDPNLALRLGAAGKAAASQRTWKRTAFSTAEFYHTCLNRP